MRYLLLILCLAIPESHGQTAEDERIDRHLAFVGGPESERGKDFVAFLEKNYTKVDVIDVTRCGPEDFAKADVVVLDWSQKDGIMFWFRNRDARRPMPLGKLEDFGKPAVLIGSAGLNMATLWGLPGSFG